MPIASDATTLRRSWLPTFAGVFVAVWFTFTAFGGQLAQRLGARAVIALGAVLAVAAGLAYLLPLGTAGLMVARVGAGVAEALVMTAGSVWVVSLAPLHR